MDNNYQVILGEKNDIIFINTDADMITVTRLVSLYYFQEKFQLNDQSMTDFFDANGFKLTYLPTKNQSLCDLMLSGNYKIIDLSSIDNEIEYALRSQM
ncbi:MAG: hypothetical protein FH753_18600 [Firmicutes bacterium]|nr:hypothetical protein [Bacillota bacterium]